MNQRMSSGSRKTSNSSETEFSRIPLPLKMHEISQTPPTSRYASREMATLWGDQRKFSTWRRLWVALAEAEAELGLPISQAQIAELRAHVDDIDFAAGQM